MHSLASYIMRSRYHAMAVVALCTALAFILPPLSYLSGAGVGLVALRHGPRQGLLVTLGAGLALGVLGAVLLGNPAPGVVFALIIGLPLCLLAWLLRSTGSLGLAIGTAALLGLLAVAGIHLLTADAAAVWRELLELVVRPALEQSGAASDARQIKQWLDELAQMMTALLATGLTLSLIISLFIARWWQAMLYNPGGFKQEFHALRLSRHLALPTVGVLALALLSQGEFKQFAAEVLAVLLVLYMIQGLALVHRLVARLGAHLGWLIALYGAMVIALPQIGMVLAAAGFADTWLNLRLRLGVANDNKHN